jgi:hypothetical protein
VQRMNPAASVEQVHRRRSQDQRGEESPDGFT